MLQTLKDLQGFAIHAADGDIGEIKEFYLDDKQWVIRYLVVETGSWLKSKKVLLSPISIKQIELKDKQLSVSITREQVKNSPEIDTQKPVSRQYEVDYMGYYGYPYYWGNSGFWGGYSSLYMIAPGYASVAPQPDGGLDAPDIFADVDSMRYRDQDHHLRSSRVVTGYELEAKDGDIGHIQGMLIDSETWAIRYLIVNTSNWWVGHLVLIAPHWIKEVSWTNSKIYVDMTKEEIKSAPLYDPDQPFDLEHKGEHKDEHERRAKAHHVSHG
jgi:hypothetical protein